MILLVLCRGNLEFGISVLRADKRIVKCVEPDLTVGEAIRGFPLKRGSTQGLSEISKNRSVLISLGFFLIMEIDRTTHIAK